MNRPVIANHRVPVRAPRAVQPRAVRTLRDAALLVVGIAAVVGTLLTTSGSLRIFGS